MRKNSMRELRHSIVLFIIGLATFCVLVGAYVFLFLDLRTRNQAVLTMHQGLLDKEAQQKERLELERTIVTTNADRQTLESYFVSGDKAVAFLETLESYGKTANTAFEIKTVDIAVSTEATTSPTETTGEGGEATTQPEVKKEAQALVFSIRALGRFQDVYHLLLLLENAPYEFEFVKTRVHRLVVPQTTTATPEKPYEGLPKVPGLERIPVSAIPFLWDMDATIRLITFTPTQSE
jgi:hypothetical protein